MGVKATIGAILKSDVLISNGSKMVRHALNGSP